MYYEWLCKAFTKFMCFIFWIVFTCSVWAPNGQQLKWSGVQINGFSCHTHNQPTNSLTNQPTNEPTILTRVRCILREVTSLDLNWSISMQSTDIYRGWPPCAIFAGLLGHSGWNNERKVPGLEIDYLTNASNLKTCTTARKQDWGVNILSDNQRWRNENKQRNICTQKFCTKNTQQIHLFSVIIQLFQNCL